MSLLKLNICIWNLFMENWTSAYVPLPFSYPTKIYICKIQSRVSIFFYLLKKIIFKRFLNIFLKGLKIIFDHASYLYSIDTSLFSFCCFVCNVVVVLYSIMRNDVYYHSSSSFFWWVLLSFFVEYLNKCINKN